ncbi:MAG: porin family protein [Treponema sp.]|jgi:hypothetical protein|nr:porin family protein [Treponema sp.]
MNKKQKGALLFVCALAALGPAFAEPPEFRISAGGGAFFMTDVGESVSGSYFPSWAAARFQNTESKIGGGAFAFLDAAFVELTIGFYSGVRKGSWEKVMKNGSLQSEEIFDPMYCIPEIGLWGKYPFQLGSVTIFPLLGLNYAVAWVKYNGDEDEFFNNILWFMAGAGADFSLGPELFLRAEALYGLHLQSDLRKKEKSYFGNGIRNWDEEKPGHGLRMRVGLGYRF